MNSRNVKNGPKVGHPQTTNKTAFPVTRQTKLRYVGTVDVDPASGSMGNYSFRANSCYDPDNSGLGHQPMGFDQWATWYKKYTVLGSTIRTTATVKNVSDSTGMLISAIQLSTDPTPGTGITASLERDLTHFKISSAKFQANQPITVGHSFKCKEFFALNNVMDNANVGALTTDNPLQQAYYVLQFGNVEGLNLGNVSALVVIEYDVVFSDPLPLGQS